MKYKITRFSFYPYNLLQIASTQFSYPTTKSESTLHQFIFDVSCFLEVKDAAGKRKTDCTCLCGLTRGTHGVKSTAVILSTCFKSAGCQPEMSSKPNLIDIMPYTAASSNEESKNFMDEQNRSSYGWSVFKSGV